MCGGHHLHTKSAPLVGGACAPLASLSSSLGLVADCCAVHHPAPAAGLVVMESTPLSGWQAGVVVIADTTCWHCTCAANGDTATRVGLCSNLGALADCGCLQFQRVRAVRVWWAFHRAYAQLCLAVLFVHCASSASVHRWHTPTTFLGVHLHPSNMWQARVQLVGSPTWLDLLTAALPLQVFHKQHWWSGSWFIKPA